MAIAEVGSSPQSIESASCCQNMVRSKPFRRAIVWPVYDLCGLTPEAAVVEHALGRAGGRRGVRMYALGDELEDLLAD